MGLVMSKLFSWPPWAAGILGAAAPYIVIVFIAAGIDIVDPNVAEAIYEVVGYLGVLFCLPTILVGAVFGGLIVWLVEKFGKPAWVSDRIQQPSGERWRFYTAFVSGLLSGPILGALIAILASLL